MKPLVFAKTIRQKTRTNSTTFTDEDILLYANRKKDEIAAMIAERDEGYFEVPQYTSLNADQREYPLPYDKMVGIVKVEAKLNGTDFIPLDELEVSGIKSPILAESDIVNKFSNDKGMAFYDLRRSSIYIYSGAITSVTNGLYIICNIFPADLTDLTDNTTDISVDPSGTALGFPRELHSLWVEGICIEWKGDKEKPIPLTQAEMSWERRMRQKINQLTSQNKSRTITRALQHSTALGNNGYDL